MSIQNQIFSVNHAINQVLNHVQDFEITVTGTNTYPAYCRLNAAIQEVLVQTGTELVFDEVTGRISFSDAEGEENTADVRQSEQLGYQVSELIKSFSPTGKDVLMLQILQHESTIIVRVHGVHTTPWYFSQGATAIGRFLGQGFTPVPIEPLHEEAQ